VAGDPPINWGQANTNHGGKRGGWRLVGGKHQPKEKKSKISYWPFEKI